MKLIKVAGAIVNQTPLDWDNNARNLERAIEQARADGVSVLVLPEMCISGYGCEDAFHSRGVHQTSLVLLEELAAKTRGMIVTFGLPLYFRKAIYSAAALVVDGQVVGFVCKQFLAGDGIHYEPRWFKPWPDDLRGEVEIGGRAVPVGDLLFDCGGVKIGFEICEDAWVAKRPGSDHALRGADLILNPSASHFAFDKFEIRKRFVTEGSRAFGVAYVYANLLGNEAGRIVYDGGVLIASGGKLIASGPRFSYRDVVVTSAVVNIDANQVQQARTGSYRPEHSTGDVELPFEFPDIAPSMSVESPVDWESSRTIANEEFARAVSLGLFDYLRKSRSHGFVVSLSGGADSAAVSCLVGIMAKLAQSELGLTGLREKLAHIPELQDARSERDVVGVLLSCVYQRTRNSSDVTRDAARDVATAIGAQFLELDVDSIVSAYTDMVGRALGRELTWDRDDISLQNIQARARGPSVWMLANLRGALLLATSNRSEAAVGYATMDGDTCGGLSPVAGIDKAFLRRWLRWLEDEGPRGVGPIPELLAVNAQQPTAELRPPSAAQTDEKDLMPYEILDEIEGAAIRDKHTPLEIYKELRARHPQYGSGLLVSYIERFFSLWCRNQWKRERYAPSFHVDDENLDPKTWCRFPILSGNYRRELAEMRAHVERELQ